MEGVHKNAIFTNLVTTDADGTLIKIEPPDFRPKKRNKKILPYKQDPHQQEVATTTIMVEEQPSQVMPSTYKSISIIASGGGGGNAESAALSLVSIGSFDTSAVTASSLEPQSIIVENIDLDALNPAFHVDTVATASQIIH